MNFISVEIYGCNQINEHYRQLGLAVVIDKLSTGQETLVSLEAPKDSLWIHTDNHGTVTDALCISAAYTHTQK